MLRTTINLSKQDFDLLKEIQKKNSHITENFLKSSIFQLGLEAFQSQAFSIEIKEGRMTWKQVEKMSV